MNHVSPLPKNSISDTTLPENVVNNKSGCLVSNFKIFSDDPDRDLNFRGMILQKKFQLSAARP